MKKFLIFDIDHTISTFDHDAGMKGLQEYLVGRTDDILTQRICEFMNSCYAAFHARAKGIRTPDLLKIEQLINDAAQQVEGADNFSDIHWSRELWIYLAAGGSLSPASAVEAANTFWNGVAFAALQYDDARRFFTWLNRWPDGLNYRRAPKDCWKTVFVTSSDARLKANHENTKLLYDSDHSDEQKLKRVSGIIPISSFNSTIFIGDPVSKPHPEFWERVIKGIGYNQKEDLALMTGDSPRSDLSGLDKFDIIPVLIDREGNFSPKEVPHASYIIRSLEALKDIMEIEYLNKKN